MPYNSEQAAKILGYFFETGLEPADICLLINGEASIAEITELIDRFDSARQKEAQQQQSHLCFPQRTDHFPPQTGHIVHPHTARRPGCDGQNGLDPGYFGDHDRYGADTD